MCLMDVSQDSWLKKGTSLGSWNRKLIYHKVSMSFKTVSKARETGLQKWDRRSLGVYSARCSQAPL